MKKSSKFLFFGFVIALMGSIAVTANATAEADSTDCSVPSVKYCTSVVTPTGTVIYTGEAKPIKE